jgi:hypothetical protein
MDCQCLAGRQPNLPALHISGLLSGPALPDSCRVVSSLRHPSPPAVLRRPVQSCPVLCGCCVSSSVPTGQCACMHACLRILRRLGGRLWAFGNVFRIPNVVSVLFHRPSEATEARAPASLLFCLCPYISVCITFTRDLHCQAGSCNHVTIFHIKIFKLLHV